MFSFPIRQNVKNMRWHGEILGEIWLVYYIELVIWCVLCLPVPTMNFAFYLLYYNNAYTVERRVMQIKV